MKRVDFIFAKNGRDILVKESPNGKFILSKHICRKQSVDKDLNQEQDDIRR
jgi:tRNA pseudouridine-54 N-methylase